MNLVNIISKLNRFHITSSVVANVRTISTDNCLLFRATPCLMGEPLKKKKKMDPAILRAREERKKKKIEKQIKRLEKNARQLKPIPECEVSLTILDQKLERQREIVHSNEVLERRALLEKKWANFKRIQHLEDLQMIDKVMFVQQKALDELKNESEELYQEAIQFDFHMVPFKSIGPVETPAIENYEVPDGEYQDVTKKW